MNGQIFLRLTYPEKWKNIWFVGAPIPRALWSKDGKHIDEGNLDTLTEPKNTRLRIPAAQRSDTGVYELILTNEAGEDKVPVKITVMGKSLFLPAVSYEIMWEWSK